LKVLGIIPARYASTRLPGKPLADIGGKSMVQRVYEQCLNARCLDRVVVATDDIRIKDHVIGFGGHAVLTRAEHPSGTDRCYEALLTLGPSPYEAVVNIQGDEPFIEPLQIEAVYDTLAVEPSAVATLAQPVEEDAVLDDPSNVLVALDRNSHALYFSRAAIPYLRAPSAAPKHTQFPFRRHVGIYAYHTDVLAQLVKLEPSPLEIAEKLEQLRWLENGFRVRVGTTRFKSLSVDTETDLAEARRHATRVV
jgi:3-deoxy-manno-octulosonate cytidylyltransferase (CMP-KDO synthetase)